MHGCGQLMLKAFHYSSDFRQEVSTLWIYRPDRFVFRSIIVQNYLDHTMPKVGKDVKVRQLADAQTGNTSVDDGLPAVAAETARRPMKYLLPGLRKAPQRVGADDMFMAVQFLDAAGRPVFGEVTGRCAGVEGT